MFYEKVFVTIGFAIIIAGALVFYNKLYYPSLPIETISKREVLEKLNTDQPIVFLSKENGQEWYIVHTPNTSESDEIIKRMVSQSGLSGNRRHIDVAVLP